MVNRPRQTHDINWLAFRLDVADKVREIGSQREAARQANVSDSTMSRIVNDVGEPDVDIFMGLCVWMGKPSELYALDPKRPIHGNLGTLDTIEATLLRDPRLKPTDALKLMNLLRVNYKALARKPEGQDG